MLRHIVAASVLIAGLSACTTETKQVVVVSDDCATYGLRVGSPEYRTCRDREAATRHNGGASEGRRVAEARSFCEDKGYWPYSERYDQCVRDRYGAE